MLDRFSDATKGALLLVSGISIFGFSDNLTLLVSDDVSVGQFHFSRSVIAMGMVIVAARLFGMRVIPKLWKPIAARTIFMVTSMLLYFGAMPMMPIAEAGAGLFTSPIFVLLFSAVLFGERIGVRRILAVVVGTAGGLVRAATRCRWIVHLSIHANFSRCLLCNRLHHYISISAG